MAGAEHGDGADRRAGRASRCRASSPSASPTRSPTPPPLATADLDGIGMPGARAEAIKAFAAAVDKGEVPLDGRLPLDDLLAAICAVPGLGPWTAGVIALRMGEPDTFPAADLGLRRAGQPGGRAPLHGRARGARRGLAPPPSRGRPPPLARRARRLKAPSVLGRGGLSRGRRSRRGRASSSRGPCTGSGRGRARRRGACGCAGRRRPRPRPTRVPRGRCRPWRPRPTRASPGGARRGEVVPGDGGTGVRGELEPGVGSGDLERAP